MLTKVTEVTNPSLREKIDHTTVIINSFNQSKNNNNNFELSSSRPLQRNDGKNTKFQNLFLIWIGANRLTKAKRSKKMALKNFKI